MKLRSGKTYYFKEYMVKKRDISKSFNCGEVHTPSCCICCETYKKGDHITSCRKCNLIKHSYHISCIVKVRETYYNLSQRHICPYCRINLIKINWGSIVMCGHHN
jgi:hypothetical protein